MTTKLANDVNVTGNRLSAILADRKLTQAQLGRSSGVNVAKINYIAKERVRIISSVTATLISVSLRVPVDELFPNARLRP